MKLITVLTSICLGQGIKSASFARYHLEETTIHEAVPDIPMEATRINRMVIKYATMLNQFQNKDLLATRAGHEMFNRYFIKYILDD